MRKLSLITIALMSFFLIFKAGMAQEASLVPPPGYKVDTRIDNMGYWRMCASLGLVTVAPEVKVPTATWTGSRLITRGVSVIDSPDICITTEPSASTQSENSIVVDPTNGDRLINSNNSTPQPSNGTVKGADWFETEDQGATWSGSVEGPGGSNSGDPAAVINHNGRWFVGYIDNASGQSVSYSDNQGASWTIAKVADKPSGFGNMLDKNHLWVDISPTSPFQGNLYDAYTPFGGSNDSQIEVKRSITNGSTWEAGINISSAVNAGSHCQGVNLKCGPDGEAYAAFAIYDGWPSDEKAIGFAKSLDGGATWQPAIRALNNIRGIRTTGVPQNMRVNSFPSMAVDLSNGPNRGAIYIVWANIGVPGTNTGSGCDVYMIKSMDEGATWSTPIKVNTDNNPTKQHYFPWVTVDQANGTVSVVFYDNRNCENNQAEAWLAWSLTGGATWEDMKVSDVTFTPSPIPNMASQYMGDYLAIAAYGGITYPAWTDTRSGHCLTYCSPIALIPPSARIEYQSYILNDTTYGNANGLMDYMEHELLGLKLINAGNANADSVTITLSTDSPYITIIDSVEYFGTFTQGQSKTILNSFEFTVADTVPDSQLITFLVTSVDKNDSVSFSTFQIMSHAPGITFIAYNVSHAAGGTDGHLVPGETANVNTTIKNTGLYAAESVVSNLVTTNPYVVINTGSIPIGTMQPGETKTVSFPVTVSSHAANGSAALFHNHVATSLRSTDKDFVVPIGLIVEDWETGNFSKYPWVATGDAPWTIDNTVKFEGLYSARSGVITHGQTTGISIEYNVMFDDTLSFYRKISSEPFNDKLKFYIDGALIAQWAGSSDWRRYAYPVLAGPHTFKWSYEKDGMGSAGQDAAWVDFIVFPPEFRTTVYAGDNDFVCSGNTYHLNGLALNYDSLSWTTSGTGTFTDNTILDPLYTPSSQDIAAGTVDLTLHAFNGFGADTASTMTLSVILSPTVVAGPGAAICSGSTFIPENAAASDYASLMWTTNGDGTFSDATVLKPTYNPGPQDKLAQGAKLKLTALATNPSCPGRTDSLQLTINPLPLVSLGSDTAVCAGKSVVLDGTTSGDVTYLWLPSQQSSATIQVDSTGTGIGTTQITLIVTDQNSCAGRDSVLVTFKDCTGMEESANLQTRIYPNPASGIFTIEIRSIVHEKVNIRLLDAKGAPVFSNEGVTIAGTYDEKINVTHLKQGNYLLEISGSSGKLLRKIVIQK